MKIDVYNAWGHLAIEEEDERRLLTAGLLKRIANGEWHFNTACFICRHWVYGGVPGNFIPLGECRHDPPTIPRSPGDGEIHRGIWPYTGGNQFCGAIETHIPEQELAHRVACYCADCRECAKGRQGKLSAVR